MGEVEFRNELMAPVVKIQILIAGRESGPQIRFITHPEAEPFWLRRDQVDLDRDTEVLGFLFSCIDACLFEAIGVDQVELGLGDLRIGKDLSGMKGQIPP